MSWVEYNKTFRELREEGLAIPGTLIKAERHSAWEESDRVIEILLLGDLNCLGGVCDDCQGVYYEDKILSYRLPKKPEPSGLCSAHQDPSWPAQADCHTCFPET